MIKHLTSVLSTVGMQLVEILSPSNLLTQLHAPTDAATSGEAQSVSSILTSQRYAMLTVMQNDTNPALDGPTSQPQVSLEVIRTSILIAMTMLLKAHLKSLYGLSEEYDIPSLPFCIEG